MLSRGGRDKSSFRLCAECGLSLGWVCADLAGMKAYVLETRGLEYAKGLFHDNAVRVYNL